MAIICAVVATPGRATAQVRGPWSGHVLVGGGRAVRDGALDGGVVLDAALYHGRGPGRIGLELTYVHLGSASDRKPGFIPIPVFTPTVIATSLRERMISARFGAEFGRRSGKVRPGLLLGAGVYGLELASTRVVRDSATGSVLQQSKDRGWHLGWGGSAGVAVGFPTIGAGLAPRLEVRLHGFLAKTGHSWTAWPVVSAGVGVGW